MDWKYQLRNLWVTKRHGEQSINLPCHRNSKKFHKSVLTFHLKFIFIRIEFGCFWPIVNNHEFYTFYKGRPCLHIVYVDGVACLHIHYVDAVSCLHIVYVDATACLHIVQVICYLVITWFCVNLPQLLQHQLSKFWACECQIHIVPVWSCHNCCSKGRVAVTKALRILALPRLARPPRPPILALVDLTTKSA